MAAHCDFRGCFIAADFGPTPSSPIQQDGLSNGSAVALDRYSHGADRVADGLASQACRYSASTTNEEMGAMDLAARLNEQGLGRLEPLLRQAGIDLDVLCDFNNA